MNDEKQNKKIHETNQRKKKLKLTQSNTNKKYFEMWHITITLNYS